VTATRALYAAAVALALAGLAMRITPLAAPAIPHPATPAAATPMRAASEPLSSASGTIADAPDAADTSDTDPIVVANIFSRSRVAPPRARDIDDTSRRHAPGPARPPALPTLYGTTIGPAGAVALIDPHGSPAGSQMYHIGDRVGRGRLAAISDSTATVDAPGGPVVLRLGSTPRPRTAPRRATTDLARSADSTPPVAATADATPRAAPAVEAIADRIRATFRRPQ